MFDKGFVKPPSLTIRGVNTHAVEVPMTFPLGTSAAIVKNAPLLLVDLETEEGITGHSYVFCYRSSVPRAIDAVLRDAISLVTGEHTIPCGITAKLSRRFALVGGGLRRHQTETARIVGGDGLRRRAEQCRKRHPSGDRKCIPYRDVDR